jgi:FkbM family methyltransferase
MTPTDPDHPLWKIIEAREATISNLTRQLSQGAPAAGDAKASPDLGANRSTLTPSGADMHSQEVELELLNRLIPHLQLRTFLDIGAEKGSMSRFFITAGLTGHLFEPFAHHADTLKTLVSGTANVFHPLAIDDQDRQAELQIATDPEGKVIPEFNSLHRLTREDLRISQQTIQPVECRSLRSLVAEGSIPSVVGLVKTDTEGNDAAVLRGMPPAYCEALCCEYFTEGLYAGWEQSHPRMILDLARQLGFEHYIVTKRRAGLTWLALGPTTFAPLTWGNFIFVRPELWTACLPFWLEVVRKCDAAAGAAHESLEAECASLRRIGEERLALIRQLNLTGASLRAQLDATGELRQKLADTHAASQQQESDLLVKEAMLREQDRSLVGKDRELLAKETLINEQQGYVLERDDVIRDQQIALVQKEAMIRELKQACDERDKLIKELAKSGPSRDRILIARTPSFLERRWDRLRQNVLEKMAQRSPHPLGKLNQHAPQPLRLERLPRPAVHPDWPRICLITPSYQQAEFLERTMRSVLDQNYPKLAYGVQDGGSTDGSAELITRYVPRLAHAESAPDGGQAAAIQRGFEKLYPEDGDIMAWLNSDDLLCPGTLAYVGDYFRRHPDVDVIYGHRIVIDDEDREIGRWYLPRHHQGTLQWVDLVPQETLFWRARCYREVKGIDPSFQFAMDWDLLLRFEEAGFNIRRLPHFLGCFRVHTHQKTSSKITTIGEQEMLRLRLRSHGQEVPYWEIHKHLNEEIRRSALTAWLHHHGLRY